MTIQSSITELGLFDLFQLLHLQRKTGRLVVTNDPSKQTAWIFFQGGSVAFAAIRDRDLNSMLDLLLDLDRLDRRALALALAALPRYQGLKECLVGEGFISEKQLESSISAYTQTCVFEVFKWEQGTCRFTEHAIDPRDVILVPLNTEGIILEGARRIDEWLNITSKVPSSYSVFRISSPGTDGQRLNLQPKEWEILSLMDGTRSVSEANRIVSGDLFTTSKLIYGLVVMGVLELVEVDRDESNGDKALSPVQAHLLRGRKFLDDGDFDQAAAEFEKAIRMDPDCLDAMRMLGEVYYKLRRYSEASIYLRKLRKVMPDNEKVMFIKGYLHAHLGQVSLAMREWEHLRRVTRNQKISEIMERNLFVARQWERLMKEY